METVVDLGVDAADEEAGDRSHIGDRLAGVDPRLEPADVGLRDVFVGVAGEDERDVDVDALGDELLDGDDALGGARHLDHEVGAIDRAPQPLRFMEGPLGVTREPRRDLEADVAVHVLGRFIDRTQRVAGLANVLDGQGLVHRLRVEVALARERLEGLAVLLTAAHRGAKDRRIGRDPSQPLRLDARRELAAARHVASNVVEPDRLACLGQGVDGGRAHAAALIAERRPQGKWLHRAARVRALLGHRRADVMGRGLVR